MHAIVAKKWGVLAQNTIASGHVSSGEDADSGELKN